MLNEDSNSSNSTEIIPLTARSNLFVPEFETRKVTLSEVLNKVSMYIGGLPKSYTETDLMNLFLPITRVGSVKICTDRHTGKSLGYGYLNFYSKKEALLARNILNYKKVQGQEIRILPANHDWQNCGTNLFFIKLPVEFKNTRQLYEFFNRDDENLLRCKLNKPQNTAYVQFTKPEEAAEVMKMYEKDDNVVCVVYESTVKKSSELKQELKLKKQQRLITNKKAVFIKNLPFIYSEAQIRKDFDVAGTSDMIIVKQEPKYQSSWAILYFELNKIAKSFLDLNQDKVIEGKRAIMTYVKEKDQRKPRNIILINNIANYISREMIHSWCGNCGMVVSIKLEDDFGHVEMVQREACIQAMKRMKTYGIVSLFVQEYANNNFKRIVSSTPSPTPTVNMPLLYPIGLPPLLDARPMAFNVTNNGRLIQVPCVAPEYTTVLRKFEKIYELVSEIITTNPEFKYYKSRFDTEWIAREVYESYHKQDPEFPYRKIEKYDIEAFKHRIQNLITGCS